MSEDRRWRIENRGFMFIAIKDETTTRFVTPTSWLTRVDLNHFQEIQRGDYDSDYLCAVSGSYAVRFAR